MIGFKDNWKQFISQGKQCLEELKNKNTRKKQIPNILTASRLLSPFFLIPTALSGNLILTGIFTGMFALTDTFDGYFARKLNASSEFGRMLDPITDKIFAGSLLIPLAFSNPLILINLIGEMIISISGVKAQIDGKEPHTVYLGKVKTTALYATIALGYLTLNTNPNSYLFNFLISSTALLQGASFMKYHSIQSSKETEVIEEKNDQTNSEIKEIKIEKNEKILDPKKIDDWNTLKKEILKTKDEEPTQDIIKQKKKNRTFK